MCQKIIALTTIVAALLLAVLASTLAPERLGGIVFFVKFFEVMIPVLAVGALIKYLCTNVWYDNRDGRPRT